MDSLKPGDPASVGGYRLLGRLGTGGMGQVFLGVSPGGRKVAVKLIHPFHAETAQFRARFAREIKAARRVGGFHTASVVDADPQANPPWMVTAYIDGPSLQEDVDRAGPLPTEGVRALGAGLAEGLAAIHASGLVHRDLKPGNVILAADGPRIIDFGIARTVDGTAGLTTAGTVVGTYAYMSPEQVRGEVSGPPSDIFSLGAVLAFAATCRPPFGQDQAFTVMYRIASDPPDLAGLADRNLAGVIEMCLAKAPQARPAIRDLLAALGARSPAAIIADTPSPSAIIADAPNRAAGPDTHPGVGSEADRETQPGREALLGTPPRRETARETPQAPPGRAEERAAPGPSGRVGPSETPQAHEPQTRPEHAGPPAIPQAPEPQTRPEHAGPPAIPQAHEPQTRPEHAGLPEIPLELTALRETPAGREAPGGILPEGAAAGGRAPVYEGAPSRIGAPGSGAARGRAARGRARRWPVAVAAAVILAAALAIALPILLRAGKPGTTAGHQTAAATGDGTLAATPGRSAEGSRPSPGASKRSPAPRPTPSRTSPSDSAEPQPVDVPDVVGDTVTQATKALEAAGFKVKVDAFSLLPGKVFDYSPTGEVAAGSTVTIDVAL
jgi:serine/threonine protein kinase